MTANFSACTVTVFLFGLALTARADIIYVDDSATGPVHNGTSWCAAFLFLQDAQAEAQSGDTIRAAQGTYWPDLGAGRIPGDRVATFVLIDGVAVLGGFAGCGESNPDQRDVELFETILSGDLADDDGTDFENNEENSYHVVTGDGADASAVIDGFTITGGNANDDVIPHDAGGGMRTQSGSPTINNCIFMRNSATFGGGMENFNGGNPTLTACTFTGNLATFRGGGMHNNTSHPVLIDTVFNDNMATNSGGGIRNWNLSHPNVIRCQFIGNHAGFGGGMVNDESSPSMLDCVFRGNTSDDTSGGLHNWISFPELVNCVFVDNLAATRGGAIYNLNNSVVTLTNCTLGGNSADVEGGGVFATASSGALLANCVVWNNPGGPFAGPGNFLASYSDIEGAWVGVGNINEDPIFVSEASADLRIAMGSPCIDAGDNTAVPIGTTTDHDGNNRFVDDICTPDTGIPGNLELIVDMGAYEFGGSECCAPEECDDGLYCNGYELCVDGECMPGTLVDADDGVDCTIDFCDEDADEAVNLPDDDLCDNGVFCDGVESCDQMSDCRTGDDPCPGRFCLEELQSCGDCLTDGHCSNDDPCDGTETCGDGGVCIRGVPTDCNENGVDDSCDISDGESDDGDNDGIPDECQLVEIPTVSLWGLVVIALGLLVLAKLRRPTLCRDI